MSSVIVFNKVGKSQVYEPSTPDHWIKFIITELGCEIAEYHHDRAGEVRKEVVAHYSLYQSASYMRERNKPLGDPPPKEYDKPLEEMDSFTQNALADRDPDDQADYNSLKPPHEEEPQIMTATEVKERMDNLGKSPATLALPDPSIQKSVEQLISENPAKAYAAIIAKQKKPKTVRQCLNCEADISNKHPNAKFCGESCKGKYHHKKQSTEKDDK